MQSDMTSPGKYSIAIITDAAVGESINYLGAILECHCGAMTPGMHAILAVPGGCEGPHMQHSTLANEMN
jgi:hypothetical protein